MSTTDRDGPINTEEMEEAKARTVHCEYCNLSGLVTVYHRNYMGGPTIEITNHNGVSRKVPSVMAAHCICPVGELIRSKTRDRHVIRRIPSLHELISGNLKNWRLNDPTMEDYDASEVPDWQGYREWLDHQPPLARKVYPTATPNRNAAYREMQEPIPLAPAAV